MSNRVMRPDWLKLKVPNGKNFNEIKGILRKNELHTVCEEALCPNIGECFGRRTATFLILGNTCTRQCGFCAVKKGIPAGINTEEPFRIASVVKKMKLQYVVITSVTRDDLADGGASVYAQTIEHIRTFIQDCTIEVLLPDFSGSSVSLERVIDAQPDILNHNIETIPRLYPQVRPMSHYKSSLDLLKNAKEASDGLTTKSGLMLGLGEEWNEIISTMQDIRGVGCDILTIGQYLSPKRDALPVCRYYTPEEYKMLKKEGEQMGFLHVESGPLVRSSYHAKEQADSVFSEESKRLIS